MKKFFLKMTQNNKRSRDYVLCHPRNLTRENYLGSRPEFSDWIPDQVRNDKKRAFTLVETLVAISVLMISVTGPLYYASESLKAATYAKEQITAFYLAQDAFEQIIKIRDDAVYHNIYRDEKIFWYSNLGNCKDGPCRVNPEGEFLGIDVGTTEESYKLYLGTNNVYSHKDTEGTKTIYSRKVTIEGVDSDGQSVALADGINEMKVTVKIEWKSRGADRSFEAYEFLRALNS